MTHGGIASRDPVGEGHKPTPLFFCRGNEANAFRKQGAFARRRRADREGRAKIERPCEYPCTRFDNGWQSLARHQAGIEGRSARNDDAIGTDPFTHPGQNQHAGLNRVIQHGDLCRPKHQQLLRRLTNATTRLMIEHTPDQEKKQQRCRGFEISILALGEGLKQTHPRDQDDTDRDRDIHIRPTTAQRRDSGTEKRPSGISDRGQRHHRRNPVQHIPGRRAHARPDRDRDHHDIPGGEPRNRQRANENPTRAIVSSLET